MKPAARIDSFKLEFLIEDALSKIVFLGKINESEDNSSELAGFEINKLLRQQSKLEQEYAGLIKQRSQLKGISNREKHKLVEETIEKVNISLRENTKKLCRLFKENTNLENDSKKVRGEREELIIKLDSLLKGLNSSDKYAMDPFTEQMVKELSEQNMLGDFLKREKDLATKIKDLKQKIIDESKEFEDIRKEKKNTIHNLKERVTRAHTESAARLRYEKKVSETKVATAKRINEQKYKQIQKEKEEIMELQKRENDVASKLTQFFSQEAQIFDQNYRGLLTLTDEKRGVIKNERIRLEVEIKREEDIMKNLEIEIEKEKKARQDEEDRVKNILKSREEEEKKNIMLDEKMKIIQFQFEEWMRLVGPKKKAAPAKKK